MRKKLKEVCDFYSGTGFPVKYQGEDFGELPFYKVGDIANNVTVGNVYLSLCNNFISHEVAKEIKGTIIPANVVVFAKIGEALKLNRRAITACDCLIDNNAMGIGGKSEYLNSMYFYFYMKNLKMEKLAESTTVPSVRKTKLEEVEIDVPTLVEQSEIVDILAKLQKVINDRQEQLEKLDDLIKARFVEMFGTPLLNDRGWKVIKAGECCLVITDGSHFSPQGQEDGYPMLSVKDMRNDGFHYESCKRVSEEDYQILKKQGCIPQKNDVLISKDGSYFYYGFVLPEYKEQAILSSIAMLRPDIDQVNPYFLCNYMLSERIVGLVSENYVTGAALKRVILKGIKQIPVMLPPIELQNEFESFVKQVDKSKVVEISEAA